jgi:hypothetical protein
MLRVALDDSGFGGDHRLHGASEYFQMLLHVRGIVASLSWFATARATNTAEGQERAFLSTGLCGAYPASIHLIRGGRERSIPRPEW